MGIDEIADKLHEIKLGIVCLTPDNLESTWIHYESGALTKAVDPKTRLWTYLTGGLELAQVKQPLGRFQATRAEKEETRSLVHSVNRVLTDDPVPDATINAAFDAFWPQLENILLTAAKSSSARAPVPDVPGMVAEILAWTREQDRHRTIAKPERINLNPKLGDIALQLAENDQKLASLEAIMNTPKVAATIREALAPFPKREKTEGSEKVAVVP